MDRKMKEALIGIVSLSLASAAAALCTEPTLQRFGYDHDSMTNKIVAGTIICGGVLVLCMVISLVAQRIIPRKGN